MGNVATMRCGRCELIVGQGCDCPPSGSTPQRVDGTVQAPRAPRGFAPERILISPQGYAHIPDACIHYVESPESAGWGWIPGPAPGQWAALSEQQPAQATAGNTERSAKRRCPDCAHFIDRP